MQLLAKVKQILYIGFIANVHLKVSKLSVLSPWSVTYSIFCATKWLNTGVHIFLTKGSGECRFNSQQMWEVNLETWACVYLIES